MTAVPDLALTEAVRPAVDLYARRTPLRRSERLSRLTGAEVSLKCENLQVTGSFKVRGALAALHAMDPAERARGVHACSAGNHGLGLAFAARAHGIPCTVVVPRGTPRVKREGMERLGAKVVIAPADGYDAAEAWTRENRDHLGGVFVSPFDHPAVMAGNGGTLMLEILEDLPAVRTVVIPCGGGGCSAGAGVVARATENGPRIVAVNTDASPGMWLSRRDGRAHLRVESAPTIAEGIEGGVSERSFRLAERFVNDVVVVSETAIRREVVEILLHERLLVEGAGAAGAAAVAAGALPPETEGRICIVLTGANLDPDRLAELLAEGGRPGAAG